MGNFKKSGHIVDVVRQEIYDGTVEVKDGKISGIRRNEVDEGAPYIMPGFVDSHIHIESTLLTPSHYAALAVAKGVVSIVTDPHEIANVTGLEGIEFMIADGRKVHFHFNFGASPCVPCTGFETAGAVIDAKDIEALLQRDEVYGVAEFMNAFGVMTGDAGRQTTLYWERSRRATSLREYASMGNPRVPIFLRKMLHRFMGPGPLSFM